MRTGAVEKEQHSTREGIHGHAKECNMDPAGLSILIHISGLFYFRLSIISYEHVLVSVTSPLGTTGAGREVQGAHKVTQTLENCIVIPAMPGVEITHSLVWKLTSMMFVHTVDV